MSLLDRLRREIKEQDRKVRDSLRHEYNLEACELRELLEEIEKCIQNLQRTSTPSS